MLCQKRNIDKSSILNKHLVFSFSCLQCFNLKCFHEVNRLCLFKHKCVGSPASRSFPSPSGQNGAIYVGVEAFMAFRRSCLFFLKVFQWHFQNSFRASRQINDLCSTRPYGEHRDLWSYDNAFALSGEGLCCYGDDYMRTLWPYPGQEHGCPLCLVRTQLLVWTIVTCNMCNKSDISSHTHSWKAWQFVFIISLPFLKA